MPLNIQISKDKFFNQLNSIYAQGDLKASAAKLLKESVNVGEAIVNVLSNTGIAGFKFNIPQREQIKLQSEITDHYTDLNNPVQDHIARKPVTITLTGLHGEYFYSVNQIEDMLAKVVPTLSLVKQFLPKISDSTKQLIFNRNKEITNNESEYKFENGVIVAGVEKEYFKRDLNGIDTFKLFQDIYKLKSSQTRAYLFFEALWQSQARFTVETTWKRFDNMTIQSVTPNRNENADITEFTVVVKQMNFTQTKNDSVENVIGRLKEMTSKTVNKGTTKGQEVPTI